MGSPLAAAAIGQRESQRLLRQRNMALTVNMLARYWKKVQSTEWEANPIRIDIIFDSNIQHQSPWTDLERGLITLQASHKVFGDPMVLCRDPLKLKQYEVVFYNPTGISLNVEALGLDTKTVEPGAIISIPQGYARGGKKSTISCIAPQLKQMPLPERDALLDITPHSFVEWCTYTPNKPSPCCNKQVLWSENLQYLLCDKCSKAIVV